MTSLRQRFIEDMQIRNFGREHPVLLRPTGIKIRTALQQITSIVGTGTNSSLSGVLNQRKEVGLGFDPRHHFRAALPL